MFEKRDLKEIDLPKFSMKNGRYLLKKKQWFSHVCVNLKVPTDVN